MSNNNPKQRIFKPFTREQVLELEKTAVTSEDLVVGLYKIVIPNWETVEKVGERCGNPDAASWPYINKEMGSYLCQKCIDIETRTCKEKGINQYSVMLGMGWIQNGFSQCGPQDIPDWKAEITNLNIRYKAEA